MHQRKLLRNILKIKVNFSSTSPKGKGFPKLNYLYEILLKEFNDSKEYYLKAINDLEEIDRTTGWISMKNPELFWKVTYNRADFKRINGECWYNANCNDIFRVTGYPDKSFTSYEELGQWLIDEQFKWKPYTFIQTETDTEKLPISLL